MDPKLLFTLGMPEHGWLTAELHYGDFHLPIDASDVFNDPVEELLNVVTKLQDKEQRRVTWWLEPGAYFFDFEKSGEELTLSIVETSDLNQESAKEQQLVKIKGTAREILRPFRGALKQFYTLTYEEKHWPYNPDSKRAIDNKQYSV